MPITTGCNIGCYSVIKVVARHNEAEHAQPKKISEVHQAMGILARLRKTIFAIRAMPRPVWSGNCFSGLPLVVLSTIANQLSLATFLAWSCVVPAVRAHLFRDPRYMAARLNLDAYSGPAGQFIYHALGRGPVDSSLAQGDNIFHPLYYRVLTLRVAYLVHYPAFLAYVPHDDSLYAYVVTWRPLLQWLSLHPHLNLACLSPHFRAALPRRAVLAACNQVYAQYDDQIASQGYNCPWVQPAFLRTLVRLCTGCAFLTTLRLREILTSFDQAGAFLGELLLQNQIQAFLAHYPTVVQYYRVFPKPVPTRPLHRSQLESLHTTLLMTVAPYPLLTEFVLTYCGNILELRNEIPLALDCVNLSAPTSPLTSSTLLSKEDSSGDRISVWLTLLASDANPCLLARAATPLRAYLITHPFLILDELIRCLSQPDPPCPAPGPTISTVVATSVTVPQHHAAHRHHLIELLVSSISAGHLPRLLTDTYAELPDGKVDEITHLWSLEKNYIRRLGALSCLHLSAWTYLLHSSLMTAPLLRALRPLWVVFLPRLCYYRVRGVPWYNSHNYSTNNDHEWRSVLRLLMPFYQPPPVTHASLLDYLQQGRPTVRVRALLAILTEHDWARLRAHTVRVQAVKYAEREVALADPD